MACLNSTIPEIQMVLWWLVLKGPVMGYKWLHDGLPLKGDLWHTNGSVMACLKRGHFWNTNGSVTEFLSPLAKTCLCLLLLYFHLIRANLISSQMKRLANMAEKCVHQVIPQNEQQFKWSKSLSHLLLILLFLFQNEDKFYIGNNNGFLLSAPLISPPNFCSPSPTFFSLSPTFCYHPPPYFSNFISNCLPNLQSGLVVYGVNLHKPHSMVTSKKQLIMHHIHFILRAGHVKVVSLVVHSHTIMKQLSGGLHGVLTTLIEIWLALTWFDLEMILYSQ